MTSGMAKPTEVVHDTARNQVTITWADGRASELPVPYLRGWCPCAGCQGHTGVVRYRQFEEASIAGIYEMGAYAICIRFDDGHDDGIFTWDWLRRIAPESPPVGPKQGMFVRGDFVDTEDQ